VKKKNQTNENAKIIKALKGLKAITLSAAVKEKILNNIINKKFYGEQNLARAD
jgi:hypothetical protein